MVDDISVYTMVHGSVHPLNGIEWKGLIMLDELMLFDKKLTPAEVAFLATPGNYSPGNPGKHKIEINQSSCVQS